MATDRRKGKSARMEKRKKKEGLGIRSSKTATDSNLNESGLELIIIRPCRTTQTDVP